MSDPAIPKKSGSAVKSSSKLQDWEENTLRPTLEKSPERQKEFTTVSSYPIRRLYTEEDLAGWDAARDLGNPGEPPYTRGIHATMHRGRLWTMRQFAGFGTAEDTNQRFRYLQPPNRQLGVTVIPPYLGNRLISRVV